MWRSTTTWLHLARDGAAGSGQPTPSWCVPGGGPGAARVRLRAPAGFAPHALIAGRRSRELGHAVVLEHLGCEPLLDLRLRSRRSRWPGAPARGLGRVPPGIGSGDALHQASLRCADHVLLRRARPPRCRVVRWPPWPGGAPVGRDPTVSVAEQRPQPLTPGSAARPTTPRLTGGGHPGHSAGAGSRSRPPAGHQGGDAGEAAEDGPAQCSCSSRKSSSSTSSRITSRIS